MRSMQISLFDSVPIGKTVNVASVPQRSPFRYPGGKTWLIPHVRRWLRSREERFEILIEPFAGGAIVGITAAAEYLVGMSHLVELDADVAAVWQAVSAGQAPWLAQKIVDFDFCEINVSAAIKQVPETVQDRAFRTILRNRVNHGGILAAGSGQLKNGENGKGLASRWYPATLARRFRDLHEIRGRLQFTQGDAFDVIDSYRERNDAAFFVDPPYTASTKRAGSRLYTHSEIDHERLFRELASVRGDVLLTYDNDPRIVELSRKYGFEIVAVSMKNTHHAVMNELLIGKDLAWAGA